MSLKNAQILRRTDGLWLEVTDPRGRHAAICLAPLLRASVSHAVETTVLAWAEAQAERTEPAPIEDLLGGWPGEADDGFEADIERLRREGRW